MSTSQSKPRFTPQQAAAIHASGVSVALSAGAGCGKTFVLTQRFLKGLEPDGDSASLHSLVAITFTDKAAREMRDRIRHACQLRLQQCEGDEVDHWLGIMRGLDTARVSTIHSFCTSLLRSQAVEAGLDPVFRVLEPAIADTLLRNTAKDVLNELLEQSDEDASALVLRFGLERARDILRILAGQRFQIDFNQFEDVSPEEVAIAWRTIWERDFIPKLISEFRDDASTKLSFELMQRHEASTPAMKARRVKLLELLEPSSPWRQPMLILQEIGENAKVQGSTAKHWESAEIYESIKAAFTDVRDAVKKLLELLPVNEDDLALAAEFSCRSVRLAQRTAESYESAKSEMGLLDFDDLLLRARDLLKDRPDVRARVASGIRLLMVDEFQDTDPVQAELVRYLCGESLTRGRLFLVGDAKQSIYRFRRADPGVFAQLREEIPEAGRLPLSINFRSQPAVLNFINHLFAAAMGDSYEALSPFDPVQYSPTPSIEFLFATYDAGDQSRETGKTPGTSITENESESESLRITAEELREREADWIARRCAELLADPQPRIRVKNASGAPVLRRVQSGDIVILFRALSNVQEYEAALRRYGIDYYLVGGKAFFAQQEIFDIVNLCCFLDDPDDLIALVGVLRSPFFNLSDDAIHAIHATSNTIDAPTEGQAFGQPLQNLRDKLLLGKSPEFLDEEQRRRIGFARETLSELMSIKDRMPIAKLLERAVDLTGYDAGLLTEHLGARKVANLKKLIDMANEFDAGGMFTLKDFVERMQSSVLEETDEEFATTLPETGNVVRLMSIHQSKGLEFPVVIVADIDRKGPPRGKSAVLHPEFGALVKLPDQFGRSFENLGLRMFGLLERDADADESIRLFYVACTRAADYLILSAGIEADARRNSPWIELVESRFDLRTGLPKSDPLLGSSSASTAGRESIPEILVHRKAPQADPVAREAQRDLPLAEILNTVLTCEPEEFPPLAKRWPRDPQDLPPLSVSRLEDIDAELQAKTADRTKYSLQRESDRKHVEFDEEVIDMDQATELGSMIHAILELVDFENPTHWPELLLRYISTNKDQIATDTELPAREMLQRFLASSVAKDLAKARNLYREVEFTMLAGDPVIQSEKTAKPPTKATKTKASSSKEKLAVNGLFDGVESFSDGPANETASSRNRILGVIDVLYEDTSGGWHILDYKSNNISSSATDEELLAPYEFQLGVYALAVEQWIGVSPREVSLVMIRPTVRKVTLMWNTTVAERLRLRINKAIKTLIERNQFDSADAALHGFRRAPGDV